VPALTLAFNTNMFGGLTHYASGRAVQVDPIKHTLKAPGTKCLKLKYDELLSSFASNFNLRQYTVASPRCTSVWQCRLNR